MMSCAVTIAVKTDSLSQSIQRPVVGGLMMNCRQFEGEPSWPNIGKIPEFIGGTENYH